MHRTDLRRAARTWRLELERALAPIDLSIGFELWDGTYAGDAHAVGGLPDDLCRIGGLWDPVGQRLCGEVAKPALTFRVQPQQLPPLASRAQFVAIFGAQRSGKTYCGRHRAVRRLIGQPGSIVFYLLPRFAKEAFVLDELVATIDARGWIAGRNLQEHYWELVNGSKLQAFSAADRRSEDAYLGGECDEFVIEEFREMPERVLQQAFSRTLSRPGSTLTIVTSPEAGHMIEEIDRGEWAGRIEWDVHHLSVVRNFWIFDEPQKRILETAKALYDERKYRRDVLGENVAEAGADYYNWDPDAHVVDEAPGTPCTELLWRSDDLWLSRDARWTNAKVKADPSIRACRLVGLDFGAKIMSAVEAIVSTAADTRSPLFQFKEQDPASLLTYETTNLIAIAEHVKEDTSVIDFVENVLAKAGLTADRAVIFCDPSGECRDHVVGQSPIDMLRKVYKYRVYWRPGGTFRKPGIDAIRARLAMRRLFVVRARCPRLIEDMRKVRTIGRGQKEISRDPHGHLPDALRYIVDNIFPTRDIFRDERAARAVAAAYRQG